MKYFLGIFVVLGSEAVMNEPIQHSSSVALAAKSRGEAREKCAGDGRWCSSVFENRLGLFKHSCITMYTFVYLGIYIPFMIGS